MDLSRTMYGLPSFVTNMPVYRTGTAISQGAVLCLNTNTANAQGLSLNVTTTTASLDGAVGVTKISGTQAFLAQENMALNASAFRVGSSSGLTSRGTVTGFDWLPMIINPDACFYARISTTVSADTATDAINQNIQVSTGTVLTITSTSVNLAGGYVFSSPVAGSGGTTPTYSGSLRHVDTTVAAGSFGLNAAFNASTDSVILRVTAPGKHDSITNVEATELRSQGAGTGNLTLNVDIGLFNLNGYVVHDAAPLHPLRRYVDGALNGLANVILYQEVVITKHDLGND